MIQLLAPFALLFSRSVWARAQVLVVGAILAASKRTVSSDLRAVGLGHTEQFPALLPCPQSRAVWSDREASRVLLGVLVKTFVPDGPLLIGVEKRWRGAGARRRSPLKAFSATLGTFHPLALRQSERLAVGMLDAFGAHTLDGTRGGVTVLERPRSI
jgi:hypothetical protein